MTRQETSPSPNPLRQFLRLFDTTQTASDEQSRETLSLEETIQILGSERRRHVLEVLSSVEGGRTTTSHLTDRVACMEYDCTREKLGSDQRSRVYTALYQGHLPRLSEADVIRYHKESNVVERGPAFDHVWRSYSSIKESY